MNFSFHSFLKKGLLALLCLLSLLPFSACGKKETDLFSYVSEYRNNILLAEEGDLSLKICSSQKETPYLADGIKRNVSPRTEFYLTAPSGDKAYELAFSVGGKAYGGDMSYDNAKREYFYFLTLDTSELSALAVKITAEDTVYELNARSVKTEELLSARQILASVRLSEKEYFSRLTVKDSFQGEIYIRLIYETELYYYVGIVDKEGKILALLCDGKTGKILAKRSS